MKNVPLITLIIFAAVLRLVNLGYSDYQGDEIKALYNPKEATSFNFFLEQRKGPVQFLVTAGLKNFTTDYRNRLLVRLPFALAGFGSVVVFYYLVKELFDQKTAFYSTIFFATNGFLVAFSRLVQYQSFVIFFGLLAVYLTKKYLDSHKLVILIWAFIALAVSFLSHYDGVFFVAPMGGILLGNFLSSKDRSQRVQMVKHFFFSTILFLFLAGLFYVPFVLNIAKNTTDYWAGRITGDVSGKTSSSRYLFSVYQPIYVLHLYTLLGILGLILVKLFALRKYLRFMPDGPSITVLSSLLLWFFIPFIFLEVFVSIPGTHIYTYLIPGFILMGFALINVEVLFRKALKNFSPLYQVGIWVMLGFFFLQSWAVFVDHTDEYPWYNEKFLAWTLPKPSPIFHLSMFGFPYYRHWDSIGDYIKTNHESEFYTTNERVSISRHHTDLTKDGQKAGYYVYIRDPQTFTNEIDNERIFNWVTNQKPVVTYKNDQKVVSEIYLVR